MATPDGITWDDFKRKYNRQYLDSREDGERRQIFQRNQGTLANHNRTQHRYSLGINKFSDWRENELQKIRAARNPLGRSGLWPSPEPLVEKALPSCKNWVTEGAVGKVKNQGQCGSCWAFAATGALEGQLYMKHGWLVSLSEQQLLDHSGMACNGGTVEEAWEYIEQRGICEEDGYYDYAAQPVDSHDLPGIRYKMNIKMNRITGEENLKRAVSCWGPVAVAVDATDKFMHYSKGIFQDNTCSSDWDSLNHAVLVVGYGSQGGQDYWLIKNSWGPDWGEDGYMRMARNINLCGVATRGCFPEISEQRNEARNDCSCLLL